MHLLGIKLVVYEHALFYINLTCICMRHCKLKKNFKDFSVPSDIIYLHKVLSTAYKLWFVCFLKIMTLKGRRDVDHEAFGDHMTLFIGYIVIGNKYCGSQVV